MLNASILVLSSFLNNYDCRSLLKHNFSRSCHSLRRCDMNGRSQMQGGKNWILQEGINANQFFWEAHWLENREKPLMFLYRTEWRERGCRLWSQWPNIWDIILRYIISQATYGLPKRLQIRTLSCSPCRREEWTQPVWERRRTWGTSPSSYTA